MKKYLPALLAICLLASVKLSAQQDPLFSQYMFNKMGYNPAAAGSDTGYITARGLFHNQWLIFNDNENGSAPISETGSIDAPIRLKSRQFYLGAGLSYSHFGYGYIGQNEYLISASCHYLPSFGGDLSLGINGGTVNMHLTPTWQVLEYSISPASTNYGFESGVGLYYSTKNYYVGFSALNIAGTSLKWEPNGRFPSYFTLYPTYTLSGGYNFYINHDKNLELQPSFFIENYYATYPSVVSCIFLYKQRFWVGLDLKDSYATSSSVIAGVVFVKGKFGDLRMGGAYEYAGPLVTTHYGGALELEMSARIKI